MSQQAPKRKPHERQTAAQLKTSWLNGDYTAQGYLYHLLRTLKKDGYLIPIDDPQGDPNLSPVQRFCAKWEINERSFYRAKAKLIVQGRITELVRGELLLKVGTDKIVSMNDKFVSDDDTNVSDDDTNVSDDDTNVSMTSLKTSINEQLENSPTLINSLSTPDHLSLNFPPSLQPETGNLNFDLEIKEYASVQIALEIENQKPITHNQKPLITKVTDEDPIQVPPRGDDEFLNFVLKTEVLTLPHPPATEAQQRRLARRLIDRDREVGDLSRAFEKWQQRQVEIASRWSEAGSVTEVSLPKTRTLGSELAKLQAFFESSRLANNGATKAMRETAIARALQLGFIVTASGIALAPGQDPCWEVSSCANG